MSSFKIHSSPLFFPKILSKISGKSHPNWPDLVFSQGAGRTASPPWGPSVRAPPKWRRRWRRSAPSCRWRGGSRRPTQKMGKNGKKCGDFYFFYFLFYVFVERDFVFMAWNAWNMNLFVAWLVGFRCKICLDIVMFYTTYIYNHKIFILYTFSFQNRVFFRREG